MTLHDAVRTVLRGHRSGRTSGHAVITGWHAALYDRAVSVGLLGRLYRGVAAQVAAEAPRDGRVLDVGTGPGRLLVEIARLRPDLRLVGVDPSPDMVVRAAARARAAGVADRVDVLLATAEALPLPDAGFDLVTSTLSAHHWTDVAAGVAEQARVLSPGGRLWVYDMRGEAQTALSAALGTHFGATETVRVRFGRLMGVALQAQRATKPLSAR